MFGALGSYIIQSSGKKQMAYSKEVINESFNENPNGGQSYRKPTRGSEVGTPRLPTTPRAEAMPRWNAWGRVRIVSEMRVAQ